MHFGLLLMDKDELIKELQSLNGKIEQLKQTVMSVHINDATMESLRISFKTLGEAEAIRFELQVILFRKYGVAMVI